jgi:hypothetical protein
MTVTVGADPEGFLGDASAYDYMIPSIGVVPGTKDAPHDLGDGFFCHEDNVAIEVGFEPCISGHEFSLKAMEAPKRVKAAFLTKDQAITYQAAHTFKPTELDHAQAKHFGCDPDFDAYTGGNVREIPKSLKASRTRFAGGHIHIGGDFNCPPFVAALFADLFLSLTPMTMWNVKQKSQNSVRAPYYGRPGIFRQKEYGIEYRTPGNWWMTSSQYAERMGNLAVQLGNFLEQNSATKLREIVKNIPWLEVQQYVSNYEYVWVDHQQDGYELLNRISEAGCPV